MLVVMTMDHFPSLLFKYTYQATGYVTTAEGFVFLSGLVAGRVYTRYGQAENRRKLWRRVWIRAGFIYSFHVLTYLIFLCLAALFSVKTWGLETWAPRFYTYPTLSLVQGVTLTYQPKFLDILPMYALLILTVPLAVELANRNRLAVLLFCSFVVWVLAQFGFREYVWNALESFFPVDFGTFDIFAWQFIFITGICIGVRSPAELISSRPARIVVTMAAMIAAVFFCMRHGFLFKELNLKLESFTMIGSLEPVRLLNFFAVALLVRQTLSWPTDNLVAKGLSLLGRHSLEVFTFHIFQLYLLFGLFRASSWKEAWVALMVGSLFLPAYLLEHYRNPWMVVFYRLTGADKKG